MKKAMIEFGNDAYGNAYLRPYKNLGVGRELNNTVLISVSSDSLLEYHRLKSDNLFYVYNVKTGLYHRLFTTQY